jgi:hypothetical protein
MSRLPASLSWNIKKSVGEELLQNVIDLLRIISNLSWDEADWHTFGPHSPLCRYRLVAANE